MFINKNDLFNKREEMARKYHKGIIRGNPEIKDKFEIGGEVSIFRKKYHRMVSGWEKGSKIAKFILPDAVIIV